MKQPTLEEFKEAIVIEPLFETRTLEVSAWNYDGTQVICERTSTRRIPSMNLGARPTPAMLFHVALFEPRSFYYTGDYTNLSTAQADAKEFGGEVETHPYNDAIWGLVFDDDERALNAAHALWLRTHAMEECTP